MKTKIFNCITSTMLLLAAVRIPGGVAAQDRQSERTSAAGFASEKVSPPRMIVPLRNRVYW
jgi:hypothetical protein